jgi:endoglucanase
MYNLLCFVMYQFGMGGRVTMRQRIEGFLKTAGKKIINGAGEEVLLRGVGLGNWLLPEGYMWKFHSQSADRPRRIEALFAELMGEEKAVTFWEVFRDQYITEADVRKIAEEGYNSIRIPINARVIWEEGTEAAYIEKNLQLIDRFIGWCKRYNLYAFLDLHGAPGGQTGANIDDSPADIPELFTKGENKRRTIALWRMLAVRYKDESAVGGYDLLNEPLPEQKKDLHPQLLPLYKDITRAIREVDPNHMVIIEGAHWATDWSTFTEKFDDNLVLQFHKYWNPTDTESIQRFLDKREELEVPIWMGESGENNLAWFASSFQLMEDHNIGWNFWPWKKMDTLNTPCSIPLPNGWNKVLEYLNGGEKPSRQEAQAIFDEYLVNMLFENCVYHPEVVNAMMRRAPVKIPAVSFGHKGRGISYSADSSLDVPFRTGERVRICVKEAPEEGTDVLSQWGNPGPYSKLHVELQVGDWVSFEVNSTTDMTCLLAVSMKSIAGAGDLVVLLEGEQELGVIKAEGSDWQEVTLDSPVLLSPGRHNVRLQAVDGTIGVHWLEFRG